MSSKQQFRSEQARKNYEKSERLHVRAVQRKAYRAKKAEVTGKAATFVKQHRKQVLIAAAAVLTAILMLWLGCKALIGPGGSIPNFFGHLMGAQDSWLIINTAQDGKSPRYQHLADFDVPAGYHLDNFSVFDDGMQQDFYCVADDEASPVRDVYISGAKNMVAAEYPGILLSYQMHKEATEPGPATIAGIDGYTVCLTFDESDTDGEGMGYRSLCMYIQTDKDACISVMISSPTLPMAELPDEAALRAEAETILSGLTLVK